MREHRLKRAALALVAGCWAIILVSVWVRVEVFQWDFKTYYYASKALEQGLNPYQDEALAQMAGPVVGPPLRFIYPISALVLFKPLSGFDYTTACRIWLALKVLALAALLVLWKREFLRETQWLWILVVALFAFQAAMIWDIKAGNVSSIEQLFLWAGFALLVRSRPVAFAACIIAAAWFKLTLSVFLLLLVLPAVRSRRNLLVMTGAFALLGGASLGPFAAHPGYFHDFITGASVQPAWLSSSPSTLSVSSEVIRQYVSAPGLQWLAYVMTGLVSIGLLFAGRMLIGRAYRSESPLPGILIACFCYALLAPRMMVYSYMIVIVPFLVMVLPAARRNVAGAFAAAIIVCMGGLKFLPANVGTLVANSEPLLLVMACWVFLAVAHRKGDLPESPPAAHAGAQEG